MNNRFEEFKFMYRVFSKIKIPVTDRFNKSCWLWVASKNSTGYGVISINSKACLASRVMWSFFHEKEIPRGKLVLHKCDNPPCVNPEHLFLGSYQDNMNDMVEKGRWKPKKGHLSRETVLKIRDMYNSGAYSYLRIAHVLGIKRNTVYSAAKGISWKNIY